MLAQKAVAARRGPKPDGALVAPATAKAPIPRKSIKFADIEKYLTDKERKLVEAYLKVGDIKEAYKLAGYKSNSHRERVFNKKWVKEAIRARLSESIYTQERVSTDRLLNEYVTLAYADITDFMDEDGKFLLPEDIPPELKSAIKQIEVKGVGEKRHTTRIVLHDKQSAMNKLGDFLRAFPKSYEISGTDGGPIEVNHNIEEEKRKLFDSLKSLSQLGVGPVIDADYEEVGKK